MATKSGPILVFVPGAWHTAACFSKIINLLKSLPSPSRCVAVDLPSVGAPEGSLARKSRQPDIDAVRTAIETEVRERRPVLLVEHSYGSVPGQEAVREFGGTGVVKQLIISGFLLDVGESILSFNKGKIPPMWDIQGDDVVGCLDPARWFYNDLPQEEQQHLVTHIKPHALVSKKSPVIYAAWRHIPTTYLVCENDKALTPDTQEFIIKRDKENGSNVTVERCMASHPPLLSMPEKVVEVIRWAAGESI